MKDIFDINKVFELKVTDVDQWYSDHHSEQDLADVYNLVHKLTVYYNDSIHDYEEDTQEHAEAVKSADEWGGLFDQLSDEILAVLSDHDIDSKVLDDDSLATYMGWYGYENRGGWFFKKE